MRALVFRLGFVLSVECVGQKAFRSSSAPGEHTQVRAPTSPRLEQTFSWKGHRKQLTCCDIRYNLSKDTKMLVLTAMPLSFWLPGNPSQRDLPLEWEPVSGHAFTNGIQYRNQGLVINETGLYYVYSNVLFRGSICSSQMLSHVVYKTNPASPGSHVLMEDKYINYCANQKMWARKSYLGALFKLRERDSLYVNVSKISLVNFEESKTFFGLFKL